MADDTKTAEKAAEKAPAKCKPCNGTGLKDNETHCPECGGKGTPTAKK